MDAECCTMENDLQERTKRVIISLFWSQVGSVQLQLQGYVESRVSQMNVKCFSE